MKEIYQIWYISDNFNDQESVLKITKILIYHQYGQRKISQIYANLFRKSLKL